MPAPQPPPDRVRTPMQINHINHKLHLIVAMFVLCGVMPVGGCRICADCEDQAYPAYGGKWQRTRRYEGRVGSVFDSAGGRADKLVDRDTPPDPDALERQRQEGKSNLFTPDSYEPRSESDQPPAQQDSPLDQLRDRDLDDIREEKEDDLRNRELDDIKIDINVDRGPNPDSPVTAALKNLLPF